MYFVIEMTNLFWSYLICIVKCSYPFRGVTFRWQECDLFALPPPDGVFISKRTGICSPSGWRPNWEGKLSPEANAGVIVLEREFSFSKCTSTRFLVRGALNCRAGQAVAQLVMSLPRGGCWIEDEPLEPRDRCLYYGSWVGASLLGTQTGGSLIGDEPSRW